MFPITEISQICLQVDCHLDRHRIENAQYQIRGSLHCVRHTWKNYSQAWKYLFECSSKINMDESIKKHETKRVTWSYDAVLMNPQSIKTNKSAGESSFQCICREALEWINELPMDIQIIMNISIHRQRHRRGPEKCSSQTEIWYRFGMKLKVNMIGEMVCLHDNNLIEIVNYHPDIIIS